MAHLGKKRVLITGAAGFTGLHLADHFLENGWEVFGLTSSKENGLSFQSLAVDIGDTEKIAEWIASVAPQYIVHLAALSHVVGDPLSFFRVNVLGTESLLEAIGRSGILPEKILVASSANVYGNARSIPIPETATLSPVNHYALSKVAAEYICQKWFDRLPIIVTRPFNYTGKGQSESFVFSKIVAAFRRKERNIRLGNLNVARDLSDISFVCEAYKRLLLSDARSQVFNICSGKSVSIGEVISVMSKISGYTPDISVDQTLIRKDEILDLRGDPSKLASQVGLIQVISLEETLERMFIVNE